MAYAQRWRPTHIVILGDFVDCYHLSRYAKRHGVPSTAEELYSAHCLLNDLDSLGAYSKYYLEGNHETRLHEKLAEAGLTNVTNWDSLLGLTPRGWKWVPYGDALHLGHIRFIHDVGPAGKHGSQQTLDFMHCNVVHGHTHRGRILYQGDGLGSTHMGMCPGWLGDYKAPHMSYEKNIVKIKSWTQGFGAIQLYPDGNFYAQLVPIV